jgi:hypothetical protein
MTHEELRKRAEEDFEQRHERYVLWSTKLMLEQSKKYKYGRD